MIEVTCHFTERYLSKKEFIGRDDSVSDIMTIKIKNLRLRTIIGVNDWERENRQEVIINARIEFDGLEASRTDDIKTTFNYKSTTKKIIEFVEDSQFFLIEKLAHAILQIIMDHPLVERAEVELDKPEALRFSDSVSVTCSAERNS
jgi:D-erythro-7,8-dihydroneopterin triphosphate epimerase